MNTQAIMNMRYAIEIAWRPMSSFSVRLTSLPDPPQLACVPVDAQARLRSLRLRMLASLGDDSHAQAAALRTAIACAPDATALWYLRPRLLMALSVRHGESRAAELVAGIGGMFDGLVPPAMCGTLASKGKR